MGEDEFDDGQLQEPPLATQIIAYAVWLYFQFPLSLRWIEEMLLERGIVVSYETIRRSGRKCGAAYAKQLRRKKPSQKDIWPIIDLIGGSIPFKAAGVASGLQQRMLALNGRSSSLYHFRFNPSGQGFNAEILPEVMSDP
ncbi:hypothetical protein GGI59_004438 [Rhizobium lentis]|uniref:Transposase n=1 Tax=Rhizobium lentis TaxID=1138194 RepID=A0A7W8XH07_9HYPH|nr:hypothetical protein [Rhizobium lentis]MBB5552211.1 hypothetical protein [Rhizobium lentis]MBB5562749.1 hypothetical protein [Rhizobium lentis]MBB5569704.1 hypothetical protein [Rhizobium lentis]